MNADVALALMAKATAVFAREGQFLSFPISPIVFSADHLGFQNGTLSPIDALTAMAEFSRRMNIVPDGVVYPPVQETMLWDVFHDLFHSAMLARSVRTAEEEKAYQAALSLLYAPDPSGLRTPTPKYHAYNQWETAWITAKQQVNQRAVEAQASTDPAIALLWQKDAPTLEQQLDAIMTRWQLEGFKDEVEHALGIVSALGAKSPSVLWETWRNQFGEGVNALSALDGDFYPTGFSPVDALHDSAWQTFSLARTEIAALVAQSPPELRARLDPTQQIDVDRITFEYTSVGLTRPWAPTDLFSARFWKLPATDRPLSDGAADLAGRLPGYVSGVVFARNVQTTTAPAPRPPPPPPPRPLPPHGPPIFRPLPEMPLHLSNSGALGHPLLAQSFMLSPIRIDAATRAIQPNVAIGALAPTAPLAQRQVAIPAQAMSAQKAQMIDSALQRLQATGVRRVGTPPIIPQPLPPAPTVPPDVQVLAFICRKLPRSPDPDPVLTW